MSETVRLTNDLLKGVMTDALVYRGICQDMNTCLTPGYYQVQYQSTKNIPSGVYEYGILTVKGTASFISQEYVPHSTNAGQPYRTVSRVWTQNTWNTWRYFIAG